MKKVIITVPRTKANILAESLKDIVYTVVESEEWIRYTLYVQDGMVDEMISKTSATLNGSNRAGKGAPLWLGLIPEIKEAAGEEDRYTLIEVSTPDFIISPYLEKLKEEWKARAPKEERTPVEKILATVEDYATFDKNKVILAAIAGIVALIGLFLNNVGIIIGAMLLSPLLGPIYALAISVATGNRNATIDCVKILAVYIILLIAIAALVTLPLSYLIDLEMTPEIASRMDANSVYIVMAVLLGLATIIALARGIPEGIAGVAIAAALLPPAVVTGIALVWHPAGFLDALTLTLQNVGGLVAGSLIGVVFLKLGPRD
ncbi:TIGR00341 family protein, partial [Methanoregula sp.]|uniref:TIGR00341 family protein n=1 Tax=Methanoregula sp. TaxID=2052170 RepID=UPI000CB926AA